MKTRLALFLTLLIALPAIAGAEEVWLRAELIRGIDLIFNARISEGERVFAAIEKKAPANPAPSIYRAMALMSYPPREGMAGIDRGLIERLLNKGITLAEDGRWEADTGRVNLLVATAYSLLSQLYLEQHDYLKASRAAVTGKRYLDEAARISPDDPDVRYGVGLLSYGVAEMPEPARLILSVLSISGDRERGIEDLKAAAGHGIYTKASAEAALLMITANIEDRYGDAVVYGRRLIARYPDNPELYFPYANALSETGDFDGARAVAATLKRKMDEGLPYFDGAIVARYHHLRGKLLMDEGRYDEAAVELKQALVVDDENYAWVRPLALARLGMIEDVSGMRDNAIGYYRRAIDTGIEGAGVILAEKYLEQPYRPNGGK
jgi:tetratricopeptide (TPR) repeat protein